MYGRTPYCGSLFQFLPRLRFRRCAPTPVPARRYMGGMPSRSATTPYPETEQERAVEGAGNAKRDFPPKPLIFPNSGSPPAARSRSPRLSSAGGMPFWPHCDSYSPTRRRDAPSGGVAKGAGRRTRRNFTTGPHPRGVARSLRLHDGGWAAVYGADEQLSP